MPDELYTDLSNLAAQLSRLKLEVRRQGAEGRTTTSVRGPAPLQRALDSSWVNPHQPIGWPHMPQGLWPKITALLKKIMRRLLQWYIDPLVAEQNTFNAAVAQSLELLFQETARLRLSLALSDQTAAQEAVHTPTAAPAPPVQHPSPQRRLRLAFFTPLSPLRTAVADHSEGLLPAMARYADVHLYIDDGYQPDNPVIVEEFTIHNHGEYPKRVRDYDAVLYAMGDNADCHGYIYEMLQRFPGIVTLHDITLHRFLIGRTLHRGDIDGYLQEMEYAYGRADLRTAQQILAGYGQVLVTQYPLIERVVDLAQGVIVHNDYARQEVLWRRPDARVTRIGQHFFLPPGFPKEVDRAALRAEMGLADRFVIASFGIFVPDKRLDSCLEAFARFVLQHPEAVYLFVGNYMDYDLPGKVRSLGLGEHVIVTGWLDPIRFTELMFVADVGVHLRYPHIGGTPFSPIRLLGLGVPTIISDIEPLAELPEGCCIKVLPDEWEQDTLLACFELLADQPDFRQQLGESGRRFMAAYHDVDKIARQYLAFIEQTVTEASS